MAQYNFGIGALTIIPPSTAGDITPVQCGVVQEVSIEVNWTIKELMGAYMFPVDIAKAAGKINGKIKTAQIRGNLLYSLMTGSTKTTGSKRLVLNESTGVISGATYTAAAGANFADDLGVLDENGLPLTKVPSAPASGQYAINITTGVYTFNASANGKTYSVTYSKTDSVNGYTIKLTNQLMGIGTVFILDLFNTVRKDFGIKLYAVTLPKLGLAMKNEDYVVQDLDFNAFADSAGNVIDMFTTEV